MPALSISPPMDHPEGGATLIEVLVAMLIISTVMLGIALFSVSGLSDNQGAYYRSQASMLAYDIADRIRANSNQLENYSFDTDDSGSFPSVVDCTTSSCDEADIRDRDLLEWAEYFTDVEGIGADGDDYRPLIPAATGRIEVDDDEGDVVVTIRWSEVDWDASDPDGQGIRQAGDDNRSITVVFRIAP